MTDRVMVQWRRWLRHDKKRYNRGNPYAPPCSYVAELWRRALRAHSRYWQLTRKARKAR